MGSEIQTKALVLHEMPMGDYDKRLVLLTKEMGKIVAFAKGARKPSSRLLAGSQTFAYGDYTLFRGKQSYSVNQIELIDTFPEVKKDMDCFAFALYILEFLDFVSEENEGNNELMQLALKTLKQLEKKKETASFIVNIFNVKAMSYIGYTPWVNSCINCGSLEQLESFSFSAGGLLCETCKQKDSNSIRIHETVVFSIRYVLENSLQRIFNFTIEKEISNQFFIVMNRFIDYNLNKKFKSLEFLKLSD